MKSSLNFICWILRLRTFESVPSQCRATSKLLLYEIEERRELRENHRRAPVREDLHELGDLDSSRKMNPSSSAELGGLGRISKTSSQLRLGTNFEHPAA